MFIYKLLALGMLFTTSFTMAFENNNTNDQPKQIDIQKFVANFIDKHHSDVPGGALVYYKAKQDTVIQTFGVSDIFSQAKVDQYETRFRIASVSKVFVAIAAAKLVEQNKLNLNASVSDYVDSELYEKLDWPVTTMQLLTHTAGFEDKFYSDSTLEGNQVQSLKQHLVSHLPKQVYEPGSLISYSNYGNSLAALVVESIVKMPFHEYVKQSILTPLNMKHSDYMLDNEMSQPLARGYKLEDGNNIEQPYTYVHRYPATSMITTSTDMQKLLEALITDNEVITPFMQRQLFKGHFSHSDKLPAMGLAFMEYRRNGAVGWWHDGSHVGYNAELMIIPEQQAGFFIVTNSSTSNMAATFREQLFNYAFSEPTFNDFNEIHVNGLSRYRGEYRNTRRNHSTFESIKNLFANDIKVDSTKEHLIFWGNPYYATTENTFVDKTNGHTLAFSENAQEELTLFLDWGGSPRAYTKLTWFNQASSQLGVLASLVLILLVMSFINLRYAKQTTSLSIRVLKTIPNILLVLFSILLIVYFFSVSIVDIRVGKLGWFIPLLTLPIIAVCTQVYLYIIHFKSIANWQGSVNSIVICLMVLYFDQYNLIGFWFG